MSRLGTELKKQRDTLSLSLEEIASSTRIPIQTLDALEQSEWSKLPAKPYACGFVKTYSKYIGLSPEKCVQLFEEDIKDHEELLRPSELSNVPEPQFLKETQSLFWLQAPKSLVFFALALFTVALLAFTYFTFQKMSNYSLEKQALEQTVTKPQESAAGTSSSSASKAEIFELSPFPAEPVKTAAPLVSKTVSFYALEETRFTIFWSTGKSQVVSMEANEIKNIKYFRPLRIVPSNPKSLLVRKKDEKFSPVSKNKNPLELQYR